jgi:hypothetical protein
MNHRVALSCAFVLAAGLAFAQENPPTTTQSTSSSSTQKTTTSTPPRVVAEVVSIDATGRTVTVRHVVMPVVPNATANVSLSVDPAAMAVLKGFKAGEQVTLSCRAAQGTNAGASDLRLVCPMVIAAARPTASDLQTMSSGTSETTSSITSSTSTSPDPTAMSGSAAMPGMAGAAGTTGTTTTSETTTTSSSTTNVAAGKQYAVEIVAADTTANTITVKARTDSTPAAGTSATPAETVQLAVQGKALATLTTVTPGDRVTITCSVDPTAGNTTGVNEGATTGAGTTARTDTTKPRSTCPAVISIVKTPERK